MNRLLLLSTALGATLALPLQAQQVFDLDEITFSANRTETELKRTGATVSVITREDLEAVGDVSVVSVLERLPGISVIQEGSMGSATSLRIRGADGAFIAVLIDGIAVNDPSGTSSRFDFGQLMASGFERIEVLRGAQSALYGGSAAAGVINLTSHRPERDGLSQEAFLEGGSYGTFNSRYTLGYRDTNLETGFTLAHTRSEGFSSYEGPLPRTPGLEADGFESTRVSAHLRYQVTDNWAVGANGFYQNSSTQYDDFVFDPVTFAYEIDPNSDATSPKRETGLRSFVLYESGSTRHEIAATYYEVAREYYSDGFLTSRLDGLRYGLSYSGSTDLQPNLTLQWGAETMIERATISTNTAGTQGFQTTGIFGQVLWAPNDALDLSASLRGDLNSAFGFFPSGRIAAAYRPNDALTLRASAGRGYVAPSLNQRFGAIYPGFPVGPNPELQPETSLSFDLGAEYRRGGFTFGATLFHIVTDNKIEFCDSAGAFGPVCLNALPAGFTYGYDNLPGATTRQGIELAASYAVGDRFDLGATYTYTDSRDPSGAALINVPRHDLGLSLGARFNDRLSGALTIKHIADQQGAAMDYTVANVSLNYALSDGVDLTLRVNNLLDAQYQVLPNFGTAGRSFHVGLAARF